MRSLAILFLLGSASIASAQLQQWEYGSLTQYSSPGISETGILVLWVSPWVGDTVAFDSWDNPLAELDAIYGPLEGTQMEHGNVHMYALNLLGREGWQLVTISDQESSDGATPVREFVLRRPAPHPQ